MTSNHQLLHQTWRKNSSPSENRITLKLFFMIPDLLHQTWSKEAVSYLLIRRKQTFLQRKSSRKTRKSYLLPIKKINFPTYNAGGTQCEELLCLTLDTMVQRLIARTRIAVVCRYCCIYHPHRVLRQSFPAPNCKQNTTCKFLLTKLLAQTSAISRSIVTFSVRVLVF